MRNPKVQLVLFHLAEKGIVGVCPHRVVVGNVPVRTEIEVGMSRVSIMKSLLLSVHRNM